MKRQVGLVKKLLLGTLLSSSALAALSLPVQAAEPVPFWWFHGSLEAGGRFFLNNPEKDGQAPLNQKSLAKYYEYSSVKPGPFGNAWLSTGSKDGLYQADLYARNIGYSDQSYYLDLSRAGKYYLSLGWDEIPHVYSMSAQTPYAVNGNRLTLLPGIPSGLTSSALLALSPKTDIGIARDTASVEYRWTPNDAWDIKADYSHMRRTGTQVAGIYGLSAAPLQLPRPVADTTQNYAVNGEYVGTSPWGQRITAKVGYFGSQYSDDFSAYFVQNPNPVGTAPLFAQVSTPPSNSANGFNGSIAADLPWKSRYVGTMSYNMMRQNEAFIPMSSQTIVGAPQPIIPAASLDGKIDTLLINNVVTTKINPELTNKLSYRYYNFHNGTPELFIQNWVSFDSATPNTSLRHFTRSLSISYTRQNAGEELVWKPSRHWTLGAAYGYERYSWDRTDADATNEHSGKVFVDWKPASWLTARSSGYYGNRRYENYSSTELGHYQWPNDPFPVGTQSVRYRESYRQFMFSNRETWKANFATDIVVARGLTVTPTFKYQDEQYGVNPVNQQGLKDRRVLSAGLEGTKIVNPTTSITAGYVRDFVTQLMFGTTCVNNGAPCTPVTTQTQTNNRMAIDTAYIVLRHAAIPDKLDTELRYTASRGVDSINLFLGTGAALTGGQFPDMTTWYQRLDASATYKFDKEQVARLGWKGDVKAKLRYTWERNSVSWYATDWFTSAFFASQSGGNGPFMMGWDNPNYDAHMIAASLIVSW